jgi:AcrR family transcriptional regulator
MERHGPQARQRILDSAADLIAESGIEGTSIREICAAAGVTAPTVYHYFGDKSGLLDAVVTDGFERYLAEKRRRRPTADPVEDLRQGWRGHVEFGLRHPAFYRLMYGGARTEQHPAAAEGARILHGIVARIAEAGLLRMPVEDAVQTIHAATVGTTILLITDAHAPGMEGLSERGLDAVINAVLVARPRTEADGLPAQAETLRGLLAQTPDAPLTAGERAILLELLARLADRRGLPTPE